jgi:hypothetical protein
MAAYIKPPNHCHRNRIPFTTCQIITNTKLILSHLIQDQNHNRFQIHQEQWRTQWNPRNSRIQIQPRFITISKNSTLFSVILYRIIIIEQFASQFSANSSPRVTNSSTITKAWEEEKLKQNQTSSKKKKIKHRFIFGFEAYQKNQKLARIYLLESPSKFR